MAAQHTQGVCSPVLHHFQVVASLAPSGFSLFLTYTLHENTNLHFPLCRFLTFSFEESLDPFSLVRETLIFSPL